MFAYHWNYAVTNHRTQQVETLQSHCCALSSNLCNSTGSCQNAASFSVVRYSLLFNTSWTTFTGSQSTLGLTSKSPLWITRLTSGHPVYLHELISLYQPTRLLRSSNQLLLTVPRANLTTDQRAFSYSSPVIWNAIPLSVRDASSISSSKRRLKSFFFHSFVS